jgi:hypothetical protein
MANSQKKQTALTALQKKFCVFNLTPVSYGDIDQIEQAKLEGRYADLKLHSKNDITFHMKRYLEGLNIESNPNKDIADFFANNKTKMYEEIIFSPIKHDESILNLWIGNTIKPSSGSCQIILDFIFQNICNNQEQVYEYLINYLAHMLQKPQEKPGVMIVLLGGQGVGKGTFFDLLESIWKKTTLLVSSIDQVLGRFNGILERNYIVMLDEALFSGDKKAAEKLKSLITEGRVLVENKYASQKSIHSFHRFFAASNKTHFVNVDSDDRRFLFLRVSEFKAQDVKYYGDIRDAFKIESIMGAFVAHLMTRDISNFNFRQRPKTHEHINQKIQSLYGFERWWHEELTNPRDISAWTDSSQNFILSNTLLELYKLSDRNAERYNSIQLRDIAAILRKICPSAIAKRAQSERGIKRGYQIPSLEIARKEFSLYLGGDLDWQEPITIDNLQLNYDLSEEDDETCPF